MRENSPAKVFVDSARTLEEACVGKRIPLFIRRHLELLDVDHWGFDGALHRGQIIVNRELADEVQEIFAEILQAKFPIYSVLPVCDFAWDDDLSMAANNSSGFNPRRIAGTRRKSLHAAGRAIDINPVQNPWERWSPSGEQIDPPGAAYDPQKPGTITENGPVLAAFARRNWEWGGHWTTMKDWHHFQKA